MLALFMLGLLPFLVVTLFFLYSHGKDLTTQPGERGTQSMVFDDQRVTPGNS